MCKVFYKDFLYCQELSVVHNANQFGKNSTSETHKKTCYDKQENDMAS